MQYCAMTEVYIRGIQMIQNVVIKNILKALVQITPKDTNLSAFYIFKSSPHNLKRLLTRNI